MNITLSLDQFKPRCIYFGEPVQNTIMENSRFIKLIYSNELVIMNGLYFEIPLNISHKATYFRRNKYFFDMKNNTVQEIIKNAQDIEYAILKKYNDNRQSIFARVSHTGVTPVKSMKPMVYDSFQHGCIKSESGSEFYNDDCQKEGMVITPNTSNSNVVSNQPSSSSSSLVYSHPSFHLNKQRLLKYTFHSTYTGAKASDTKDHLPLIPSSSTTSEEMEQMEQPGSFSSWHVILKVSGIWETVSEFGLTYKFIMTPKYNET